MNAKKCKALRRHLRQQGIDIKEALYDKTNVHLAREPIGTTFGEDGGVTIMYGYAEVHTAVLHFTCGRAIYRQIKSTL